MKNLKTLRKSADMTLKQLADELGTSTQVLSRYERGEHQADYETLAKIARFFNVSIDYLLDFQAATKPISDTPTIEEKELLTDFRQLPEELRYLAKSYVKKLLVLHETSIPTQIAPVPKTAPQQIPKKKTGISPA